MRYKRIGLGSLEMCWDCDHYLQDGNCPIHGDLTERAEAAQGAAPRAEVLDVDTLLAAERVVQGWEDEISEGGMTALILELQKALERRVAARLSRLPSEEERE